MKLHPMFFFVVAVILFSCLACNFFYHRFLIDGFGDVCCGTGGDSGCANLHCLLQEDAPHWTRWSREQSVIFTFSRSAVMMVINCSRRTVIKLQIQQSGVRMLIAEKGWKFISFALFNGGSICNFRAFVFLNRARIYLFIYCLFLCRIIALSELHSLPKVICIIKQTLPPPSPSLPTQTQPKQFGAHHC